MSSRLKGYPGIEVRAGEERELCEATDTGDLLYARAAGEAMGRFLEALKEGRILGRRCGGCGRVLVPPRAFCERCFRPTSAWVEVKDSGRVTTYAVSYISTEAGRLREPVVLAVVELEGASPGMGFLHVLGEVAPERVEAGLRVRAVWKPPEERTGAITDIRYFKPVGGE